MTLELSKLLSRAKAGKRVKGRKQKNNLGQVCRTKARHCIQSTFGVGGIHHPGMLIPKMKKNKRSSWG